VVLKVQPGVPRVGGRLVRFADGLKQFKACKKMPAVKSLDQAPCSNTKPEQIMGHSCQALALLVKAGISFQAIPLKARMHEGLVSSNRDRRTLLDKRLLLLAALQLPEPVLLAADACLPRKSKSYRTAVSRKLDANHRHIQVGLVAQGLLQCLAATQFTLVLRHFGSWLRTVRAPHCASEFVVASTLRNSLLEFLATTPNDRNFTIFLREQLDLLRIEGTSLAAA